MNASDHTIESGCFWYPFRPWLRWPIRLLGAVGIVVVLTKLLIYHRWSEATGLFAPIWLFLASFVNPEPKLKTPTYFVGAVLAWLAVGFTLLLVGLWIFTR